MRLALLLVLAGVLVSFVALGPAKSAEEERIAWETDLAAATATAKEKGRPLMVVFR